ncbi:metallophosphoesterase [Virgibacillus kapii]|uniref:Metallophosphoesterase n=1 Tax=Virgibacillus kapii TaxID=1638645 RepID=A0ABQ2D5D6_9BACI|nr:metallophosphoesterase [Virgibacillus salexigens]EQB36084.1 hypothetical protein M948_13690 [Virgibacillus sp. CM-4]MYL41949.1 metallophosphoesterase [Virgibacillus massiliensis]GGJ46793.1 metallophosphoesterase [Virgibacillus kapii]
MIILCSALLILIIIGSMIYLAYLDTTHYHSIQHNCLPEEFHMFRIFFISDIHRRRINKKTIDKIKKHVDIIVIGGDLTEKYVPLSRTRKNLHLLKQLCPTIYFIWGNNDYEVNTNDLIELLLAENITILKNTNEELMNHQKKITLLALDCMKYGEPNFEMANKGITGDFRILLTHDPMGFYTLCDTQKAAIQLVLSGHTHGGQIRFLGFGPYESGSFKNVQNTSILVSEGYGFTTLPFRLGTRSQCHVITLEKKT